MSKEKKEDTTEWKFNGDEDDWENFDRRVTRYMRKKYDLIGELMWIGEIGSVFSMEQAEYELHCSNVMKAIYCSDPSESRKLNLFKTKDDRSSLGALKIRSFTSR